MKNFLISILGGLIGAAAGLALKLLLPGWLFWGVGVLGCAAMLVEIGAVAADIIRERRWRKEGLIWDEQKAYDSDHRQDHKPDGLSSGQACQNERDESGPGYRQADP